MSNRLAFNIRVVSLSACMAISLILASPAAAQDLIERTVCVFDFAALAGSDQAYARLCADTISIQLELVGYTVVAPDTIRQQYSGDLMDEAALLLAARRMGADVAVLGFYTIDDNGMHIGVQAIDIFTERPAMALVESGKAGFEVFDTVDAIAVSVAGRIRQALKPLPASEVIVRREAIKLETTVVEEIVGMGEAITISLRSKNEGAVVWAGEKQLGVIQNGNMELTSVIGSALDLKITLPAHEAAEARIIIHEEMTTVTLPELIFAPSSQLHVQLTLQKPYGALLEYQRIFFRNILTLGLASGFHYIPGTYNQYDSPLLTAYEDNGESSYFMMLPVALALRFYPLNIFSRNSVWQPYLKLGLCGDYIWSVYMDEHKQSNAQLNLALSLGQVFAFGRFIIDAELELISPPLVDTPNITSAQTALIFLKTGVGFRW